VSRLVTGPLAKDTVLDPPGAATVKIDSLIVRTQPAFAGDVLAHVLKGQTLTVLEQIALAKPKLNEPANWARISLPTNAPAWVFADYINTNSMTVTARRINVRGGPGDSYGVVALLDKGAAVKQVRRNADWIQIEPPSNAYGFVASDYLTMLPPVTPPPALIASVEPAAATTAAATTAATAAAAPVTTEPVAPAVAAPATTEPSAAAPVATAPPPPEPPAPPAATPPATEPPATAPVATAPATPEPIAPEPVAPAAANPTNEATAANETTNTASATGSAPPIVAPEPVATAPATAPATTEPAPTAPVAAAAVAAASAPAAAGTGESASIDTKERVVAREGYVRKALNVQAPTDYELRDVNSKTLIEYLLPDAQDKTFKKYAGARVLATGTEWLDPRWPKTPILRIQTIQTVDPAH